MLTHEKTIGGTTVRCDMVQLGEDAVVLLYGGDRAHIGSSVLAIPRPSLTGEGISATSSVLNCPGHKDELLARLFAERLAAALNRTVACICGVHVDGLDAAGIQAIMDGCQELLDELLLAAGVR